MKFALAFLLLVLPALIESSPSPWWGRPKVRKSRPQPRPAQYPGKCYATGDPHYTTFDRKRFNFMGACRYIHVTDYCVKPCGPRKTSTRLGTFKVIGDNVKCGRGASCLKSVEVIIRGKSILLQRRRFPPAENTKYYSVSRHGGWVVVQTKPAGLMVKWDRNMGLHIFLTAQYKGKVCGLCGNFDGNAANDWTVEGGKVALTSARDFAQFWQAGGDKCGPGPKVPAHPCENKPKRRQLAEKDCGVIKSNHFQNCKTGKVDLDKLYDDCVYDVCEEEGSDVQSSCEAIKEAAEECLEETGKAVSMGHLEQTCKDCTQAKLLNSCQVKCCVFPFKYKGRTYNKCVKSAIGSWCSTDKNANGNTLGLCQI